MRQTSTIEIDAPASVVFDVLTDMARFPEWAPEVESVKVMEETEDVIGTRYQQVIREGSRTNTYEVEVTDHRTDAVNEVRFEAADGISMVVRSELTSSPGGGTRLARTIEVGLKGILTRLMAPIIWIFNRRIQREQLGRIKELAEADAA